MDSKQIPQLKALQSDLNIIARILTIVTLVILLGTGMLNTAVSLTSINITYKITKQYWDSSSSVISKKILSLFLTPSSFSIYSSSSKKKKLIHSSIRIEEEVLISLQKEAERQGISFNSLINKTLKNYVISEMHFEQLGFILVSKNFLRKTFAELEDEKRLEELGNELGLIAAKEYVSYFFPKVDSITLVQFLDICFRRFESFKHRIDEKNNNHNNND